MGLNPVVGLGVFTERGDRNEDTSTEERTRGDRERPTICKPRREIPEETNPARISTWDFQPPEL